MVAAEGLNGLGVTACEGVVPQAFLNQLAERVGTLSALQALFVSGSLARGTADAFSDVDLVGVVPAEGAESVVAQWRSLIEAIAPVVFWSQRSAGGTLVNAITADWLRCDLLLAPAAALRGQAKDLLRPLYDPLDLYDTLPETLPVQPLDPRKLTELVKQFLRVLGLLVVVDARREYVTGVAGVGMLAESLKELELFDVPLPYRGGALHLTKLLKPDQVAMFKNLPFPKATREEVVDAHFVIARRFLPAARARSDAINADWPEAFEAATRKYLVAHFGEDAVTGW